MDFILWATFMFLSTIMSLQDLKSRHVSVLALMICIAISGIHMIFGYKVLHLLMLVGIIVVWWGIYSKNSKYAQVADFLYLMCCICWLPDNMGPKFLIYCGGGILLWYAVQLLTFPANRVKLLAPPAGKGAPYKQPAVFIFFATFLLISNFFERSDEGLTFSELKNSELNFLKDLDFKKIFNPKDANA
jgi:hypothetical protein